MKAGARRVARGVDSPLMTTRNEAAARRSAARCAPYFPGGLTKMKKELSKIREPWNAIL
jgi:hypothetical protein